MDLERGAVAQPSGGALFLSGTQERVKGTPVVTDAALANMLGPGDGRHQCGVSNERNDLRSRTPRRSLVARCDWNRGRRVRGNRDDVADRRIPVAGVPLLLTVRRMQHSINTPTTS